jgi:hypothetical protein
MPNDDELPPPPDLGPPGPERKLIRATASLEKWMWETLDYLAAQSGGRYDRNGIHREVLRWALPALERKNKKQK